MIKATKKLKTLASLLDKDNNTLIHDGIVLLREEQPFEGAIGLLTSFYDFTDDIAIRKAIEQFMNDLKDQSASTEIINEIRKKWKAETISMLVSSCWQSGLDYSEYSFDLAEIFLRGDYVTAIECLTVIEESVSQLTSKRKDDIIKHVKENFNSLTNEKKGLSIELLSILES